MGTHDKTFYGITIPFTGLANIIRKRFRLGYGLKGDARRLDESPLVCKGIDISWRKRLESLARFVNAVKVQSSLFRRIRKNVFFKGVIAKL
jgi:hypothetical protein